jgi:cytoskeletal protein CcmA (bactofilin family)
MNQDSDPGPYPWVNAPNEAVQPVDQQAQPITALEVPVGNALPPLHSAAIPVLQPLNVSVDTGHHTEGLPGRSMLADGMHFVGNAVLRGPCSIAGLLEGNLMQDPGAEVSVVVTETGRVKGDITAQKISVMGQTDGILDAGQGEVSLHDTARVQGLVRYGRIQVNGADLNATLERANPPDTFR